MRLILTTSCAQTSCCSRRARSSKSKRGWPKNDRSPSHYFTIFTVNSFHIIRTVRLTEKGTRQGSQPVRFVVKDKNGKVVLDKDGKPKVETRPLNQYTVVADPRA